MPLSQRELDKLEQQANEELLAMLGGDDVGDAGARTPEQELAAMLGGTSEMTPEEELAAMCDQSPAEELATVEEELGPLIASSKVAKAQGKAAITMWKQANMARYAELRSRKRELQERQQAAAAAAPSPSQAAAASVAAAPASSTLEAQLSAVGTELAPILEAGRAAKAQGAAAKAAWQAKSGARYVALRKRQAALQQALTQRAAAAAEGEEEEEEEEETETDRMIRLAMAAMDEPVDDAADDGEEPTEADLAALLGEDAAAPEEEDETDRMIRLAMEAAADDGDGEGAEDGEEATEADLAALLAMEGAGEEEEEEEVAHDPLARLEALEAQIAPIIASSKVAKAQGAAAVTAWKQTHMATYAALRQEKRALQAEIAQLPPAAAAAAATAPAVAAPRAPAPKKVEAISWPATLRECHRVVSGDNAALLTRAKQAARLISERKDLLTALVLIVMVAKELFAMQTAESRVLVGTFLTAAEALKAQMRFDESAVLKQAHAALEQLIIATDTSTWAASYASIEAELTQCVRTLKPQKPYSAANAAQLARVKEMWQLIKSRQQNARQPPPALQRWSDYDEIAPVRNDDVPPNVIQCTILKLEGVDETDAVGKTLIGSKLRIKYYFNFPKACLNNEHGAMEGETDFTSKRALDGGNATFTQTEHLPLHTHGCTSKSRIAMLARSKRYLRFDVEKKASGIFGLGKVSPKASCFLEHPALAQHATVERDLPLYAYGKERPTRGAKLTQGVLKVRLETKAAMVGGETKTITHRCPLFTTQDFPLPLDAASGRLATQPLEQLRVATSASGANLCSSGADSAINVLQTTSEAWDVTLTHSDSAWICFDLGRSYLEVGAVVSAVSIEYTAPRVAVTAKLSVEVQCAVDSIVDASGLDAPLTVATGEQRVAREWIGVGAQRAEEEWVEVGAQSASASSRRGGSGSHVALGPGADASGRVQHWCARWWRVRISTTQKKKTRVGVKRIVFLGGAVGAGGSGSAAAAAGGGTTQGVAPAGLDAAAQRLASVQDAIAGLKAALNAAKAQGAAAANAWKEKYTDRIKALVAERNSLRTQVASASTGAAAAAAAGVARGAPRKSKSVRLSESMSLKQELARIDAEFATINAALQAAKAAVPRRPALAQWKSQHHTRYKELGALRAELALALTPVPPEELEDPLAVQWMSSVEVLHSVSEGFTVEAARAKTQDARQKAQISAMASNARMSSFEGMIQREQLSIADYFGHCVKDRMDADTRLARALREAGRGAEARHVQQRVVVAMKELGEAKAAGLWPTA